MFKPEIKQITPILKNRNIWIVIVVTLFLFIKAMIVTIEDNKLIIQPQMQV